MLITREVPADLCSMTGRVATRFHGGSLPSDPRPSVPSVLGFTMIGELGRGAGTVVYRVRRDGADWAMKVRLASGVVNQRELTAFRREAALLALANHAALPNVHEVGLSDGRPYLVMDLIEGQHLAQLLRGGRLSGETVQRVAVEVAEALAAAHQVGLVHRDVKPHNIMVQPDGSMRLIDFGLATMRADYSADTVVGTLAYSAPEQSGTLKRVVDARSDLYSLGVVLFECATGIRPFTSADVGELLRMHATTPAADVRALRPELSGGLAAVIATLLAKDPDDRYQTADALVVDLHRLAVDPAADLVPHRASPSRASYRIPLTGRDAELAELLSHWRDARAGRGGVAVVRGDQGSGKSRLLGELSGRIEDDGFPVLYAPADDSAPLAPLRRAVEGYVGQLERMEPARRAGAMLRLLEAAATAPQHVARLSPVLAELLTTAGTAAVLTGSEGADGFIPALVGFVVELARRHGGALLCIDDAERLDGATQWVLAQLAAAAGAAPLLVVTGVGGDDADRTLGRTFRPDTVGLAITMEPLDDGARTRLIGAFASGLDLDNELVMRLDTRGARTPLEIMEYLTAVIDAGLLSPMWGSWVLDVAGLDGLALPDDLLGLVARRIDGMGEAALDLLGVAAVIGLQFDSELTARVAGVHDGQDVADILERAVARGVLMHSGKEYAFTHERARSALLERMDPDRVRALHQRVAEKLDTGYSGHRYAVARHYLNGTPDRDPARAVHAWVDAAEQALVQHAGEEAVEFLERAQDLLSCAPDAASVDLAQVRSLLADAYAMSGRLVDAVNTLTEALASATDRAERARILLRTSLVQKTVWDMDGARRTATLGLAELGHALPANRVLLILSTIGAFVVGRLVEVTGLGFGTATGQRRLRFQVLTELAMTAEEAAMRGGRPILSLVLGLWALYPAARLGPSLAYVRYRMSRSIVAKILGLPGGDRSLARAERVAASLGTPEALALVRYGREAGRSLGRAGDEREMLRLVAEMGNVLPISEYLDGLSGSCYSLLGRGRAQEAWTWYERAAARLGAADLPDHNVELIGLAAAAGLGRVAETDARLRHITENSDIFGSPGLRVNALAMTAIAALEQHDLGERFERIAAGALTLNPRMLLAPQRIIYATVAYGMLERCRTAPADRRLAALAEAGQSARALRRVPAEPILSAHALVIAADLRLVRGDACGALAALAPADAFLNDHDVPLATFEAARVRARACAELGRAAEASAHASFAVTLAEQYGWPHRADWVRTEFSRSGASACLVDRATRRSSVMFTGTNSSSTYGRRLAALEQLSLAASRIVDPVELTRVALDQIIQILAAERAFLFVPDSEEARLIPYLGRDAAGNDIAVLTEYGSTLVERVRADREPLVVTGTDEGAALGSQSAVIHGLRSIMVAPLLLDGRLIGVVYLDSRIAKGMFTPADVGTLTAITTHVAAALETARAAQLEFAVHAAQQQLHVAEIMRDAMNDLAATLDPREVLGKLHAIMTRVLPADTSSLLVLDGNHLTALSKPVGAPAVTLPAAPGGALDRLLHGGSPTASTDATGAELLGLDPAGTASWIAVPLRARDTIVGLLVLTTAQPEAYRAAEVELAAALAVQGMVAYDNARLFAEVRHLAVTDGLTGVYNRRHFFSLASAALEESAERGTALSAVMLDIDNFKRVNDMYGHPIGDQVIKAVADRVARITRNGDLLARYGGEEFALILSHPPELATQIGGRIRAAIAETLIDTDAGPVPVTVSVGIAHRTEDDTDPGPLLGRADQALYQAKQGGRDRVVVYLPDRP